MGHHLARLLGGSAALTLALTLSASAALADCGYLPGDKGASYVAASTDNGGVKASLDFTGETIGSGELMGNAVVIDMNGTDEYIILGTYKGASPGSGCPTDTSDKNAYREGVHFTAYFCDTDGSWPTYTPSDSPVNFEIYYVGFGEWDTYVGAFSGYRMFDAYQGQPSVMAWMTWANVARGIDTEFDSIKRYGTGGWVNFSSSADPCEDVGYDLREVTSYHVWAEKQ